MGECIQDIPPYLQLGCEIEQGRINSVAFVTEAKAALADEDPALWSDPAFWDYAYEGSDFFIHRRVSGSYAASDVTVPGKGTQTEKLGGKTHVATMRIEALLENNEYWDVINVSETLRCVIITNGGELLMAGTRPANISANAVVEDSLESLAEWEVVCTWSDILVPVTVEAPLGIFDS